MTATAIATRPPDAEHAMQALLDLIEVDRARQCAAILAEAGEKAAALRAQASKDARQRMRAAFAEQRRVRAERVAAAQARLATHRRLHEQQRTTARLALAWQRLPIELLALWRAADSRATWVAHTMAAACSQLPPGEWRVQHAADWPAAERERQAAALADIGTTLRFETLASITAGLKIAAGGNVIDGSLAGLLTDRAEIEARLLRLLENPG